MELNDIDLNEQLEEAFENRDEVYSSESSDSPNKRKTKHTQNGSSSSEVDDS